MNCKRPLILISNDDGYNANGIKTLVSFLSDFADILVCAPEGPRSGSSCAFSANNPLRLNRLDNIPNCDMVMFGNSCRLCEDCFRAASKWQTTRFNTRRH